MWIKFAYGPLSLSILWHLFFIISSLILCAAGVLRVEGEQNYYICALKCFRCCGEGLYNLKRERHHTHTHSHSCTVTSPQRHLVYNITEHQMSSSCAVAAFSMSAVFLYCFTAVTSLCKCCCYKDRKVILHDWQIHSHMLCCLSSEGLMFLALSFTYRLGLGNIVS